MPFLENRIYYDADGHWQELPDALVPYADPDIRARLAPLNRATINPRGMPSCDPDFYKNTFNRKTAEEEILSTQYWAALGATNSTERRRALDLFGLHGQLVFPSHTPAAFDKDYYGSLQEDADDRILYGGALALNRALTDFCSTDKRLFATAYVPLRNPELALLAAQQAVQLGCSAIGSPHWLPERYPWTAPEFEPFWAFLDETRKPLVVHKGRSGDIVKARTNARIAQLDRKSASATTSLSIERMLIASLIFDGIFERFPRLKLGIVEMYADWVPALCSALDLIAVTGEFAGTQSIRYSLPLLPSEYIRRQVRITPASGFGRDRGDDVAALVNSTAPEIYMFSTDWPHDPFGPSATLLAKSAETLDAAKQEMYYCGNFADLLGLSTPANPATQ